MSTKLPPDFNPERYAAAYPDVALSGLDPKEHYLRFGRLMGRSPSGKGPAAKIRSPEAAARPASATAEPAVQEAPALAVRSPIIDRPPAFDPQEVAPRPAPARVGVSESGTLQLSALMDGPFTSEEAGESAAASVTAYARLLSLPPPHILEDASPGSNLFKQGVSRIETAWFADPLKLRLVIGVGGNAGSTEAGGWVLRAYQAEPATPGELRTAGAGVQLAAQGPTFHDIELRHSLMPVLLELADAEGSTKTLAILPFPSLLPGGVHSAELKALQAEANPMDAFWALSEALLEETTGRADWPDRSIGSVCFHEEPADSPSLALEIEPWMAAVFGLSAGSKASDLQLTLPRHCVPTISALASRRLDLGRATRAIGPFLVAEEATMRPRWSVSLPANFDAGPELPILTRPHARRSSKAPPKAIPIHLAIAMRPSSSLEEAAPVARPAVLPATLPLTVVLRASNAARTEALLKSLLEVTGRANLDLVLASPLEQEVRQAIDLLLGSDGWRTATSTDLRDIASKACHETLLTLDDRVKLGSGQALQALAGLLQSDDSIASMSCLLLGETTVKKDVVLQPGSGGLFPARVSFASSPRLGFAEPDVTKVLPNLTYPVVANTLLLTLWRTRALGDLPRRRGPDPSTAADIRIGLELLDAGYRNFCTTTVQAVLSGPYQRRDAIDPVGAAYLQPARWEEILDQVTILQELF